MFLLLITASATAVHPAMPVTFQGDWDLSNRCQFSALDSDSRLIVRQNSAVFGETVFTPNSVLKSNVSNWTATGKYDDEGEVSKGRLTLHLSNNGKTLSYTNHDGRLVKLNRCGKK
jgi:hypothetical protein